MCHEARVGSARDVEALIMLEMWHKQKMDISEFLNKEDRISQPRIAVILPTRGMIFTEVEEVLERERKKHNLTIYRSHDLPIPDCLNVLVSQALNDGEYQYLWFVEEDTVPPDGALDQMIAAHADVIAIKYAANGGFSTIVRHTQRDEILFTGFGCTLVDRKVFDKLQPPFFRADKMFNISISQWQPVDPHKAYGQHDIYFGFSVREKGFRIQQAPGECRHLRLDGLGQREVNNGLHQIGLKEAVTKEYPINMP